MIEIGSYFSNDRLSFLIDSLLGLPMNLRPRLFSFEEHVTDKKNSVDNHILFNAFLKEAASGFFLFSDKLVYQFLIAKDIDIRLLIHGAVKDDVILLLRKLSNCLPEFAYASNTREYKHRNILSKHAPYGYESAKVGNDYQQYLPGLYWITVIPSKLIQRHNIPLEKIRAAAIKSEELTNGVWIFTFFNNPDEWKTYAKSIDQLCGKIPGIFSIKNVHKDFKNAKTFIETSKVTYAWR